MTIHKVKFLGLNLCNCSTFQSLVITGVSLQGYGSGPHDVDSFSYE